MERGKSGIRYHGPIVAGLIITGVVAVASFALIIWDPWRLPAGSPAAAAVSKLQWDAEPQPEPTTAFTDAGGVSHTLADFKGRVLVVNFWATWCEPCVREMPTLDALQAKLGGDGFNVIAVNQDRDGAKAASFLESKGWHHLALYLEPGMQFAKDARLRGLPTTLVIDRGGREVARLEGPSVWDSPEMIAALRQVMDKP